MSDAEKQRQKIGLEEWFNSLTDNERTMIIEGYSKLIEKFPYVDYDKYRMMVKKVQKKEKSKIFAPLFKVAEVAGNKILKGEEKKNG